LCPDIVLGKYVAITSIDSGQFVLTDKETEAGWQSRGRIAYSPKIQNIGDLRHAGWDGWYVFDHPSELGTSHLAENIFEVPHEQGHVSVFVNYRLVLNQPEMKNLAHLFWQQIALIQPESFVADNDYLNFVSANKPLFASVRDAVKAVL